MQVFDLKIEISPTSNNDVTLHNFQWKTIQKEQLLGYRLKCLDNVLLRDTFCGRAA